MKALFLGSIYVVLIVAAACLCGCHSFKKAQQERKIERAQDQFKLHPESFADLSSKYFPCVAESAIDTSPAIDDSAYQAAINERDGYIEVTHTIIDSLSRRLDDTSLSSDSIKILTAIVTEQADAIIDCNQALRDLPPIIKEIPKPYPVTDKAVVQSFNNIIAGLHADNSNLSATNAALASQHAKDKRYIWLFYGLLALIVVFIAGWFIAKIYTKR